MERNYDTPFHPYPYSIYECRVYARYTPFYRHGKRFKSARTELMIEYREHPNSETHDRHTHTYIASSLVSWFTYKHTFARTQYELQAIKYGVLYVHRTAYTCAIPFDS